MISLMLESKRVKLVEADSKMVVAREKWVREIKRWFVKGYKLSVTQEE